MARYGGPSRLWRPEANARAMREAPANHFAGTFARL